MWTFIKSSTNNKNFLMGHSKEICFIGRSNVGKSSLINAIVKQKALARTSNTPGRTQLINFFQEENKTIVDLPGYGFAKMPIKVKNEMNIMIQNYFETRKELVHIFILIDAKVGPTNDDHGMIEYLKSISKDFSIVLTKHDKPNQKEFFKTSKKLKMITKNFIAVSSKTGKNIGKLRQDIINMF
ncbi:ribosome biogenesis GTP-binding protein YihA/YsxC [Candidatus Mycoplasma mahonii]|uniref:ribosome biogenesis GTP-binding protein YihA/YsxC n=1 Tax=Candidatus Mycoplasma mahonii TaxID=3004105 RepID=UPI0026EEDF76|nr:ribosome biogenesis GTP-binding protein YihA/YsxC [Candidatus Mycoplasma mahonii]WKX02702.1 ribosome biogenesis GTP-binding protein YihA/YsxC [Candidatus Mycoplasma mahonii]